MGCILYERKGVFYDMTRSYKHWSKQEESKLLELREEKKLKFRVIAKLMDRTPISVEKRYRKLTNNS